MATGTYRCESIESGTAYNEISTFNFTSNLKAELDGDPIQVYLRIRSPTNDEMVNQVPMFNYTIQEQKHLILQPMKNIKSKMSQCCHRFSFSKIFDCSTSQDDIFNCTAKEIVKDFSEGNNRLIFNYGVTNAGKTYTMQGSNNEPGIIPRSLDYVFQCYSSQISSFPKFKPHDGAILKLSYGEAAHENKIKNECLKLDLSSSISLSSTLNLSRLINSYGSISTDDDSMHSTISTHLSNDLPLSYSIWISFIEIYNEQIFDLLGSIGSKTRKTLKLRESENGSSFLQGVTEIFVNSSEEAFKLLRIGRQVLRQAPTKLNSFSSRSHCIFTIKMIRHVNSDHATASLNQLSFCDLAGSERTNKTQNVGQRLRETGVINTSLMVLGRCINYLRQNQNLIRENPLIVPFRDSKLTKMLKAFLTGHGKASMLINISPCADMFDETLHVLKFSAMAKELSLPDCPVYLKAKVTRKSLNNLRQSLVGDRSSIAWETSQCVSLSETQMDDEESEMESEAKLNNALEVIEILRNRVIKLDNEKLQLEIDLREELCTEFAAQLKDTEDYYRDRIIEEEERYEQMASERINNLEDYYLNRQCPQCAERVSRKLSDASVQCEALEDSKVAQPIDTNLEATNDLLAERIEDLEKELMEKNAKCLELENQLKAITEEREKSVVTTNDVSVEVDIKECSTNIAETQTSFIEEPSCATKSAKNQSLRKSLYFSLSSSSTSGDEVFKHPLSPTTSKDDVSISKIPEEFAKSLMAIDNMQNQMNDIQSNIEQLVKQATTKTSLGSESANLSCAFDLPKDKKSDLIDEEIKNDITEMKDLLLQMKVDMQTVKESFNSKDDEKGKTEKNIQRGSENNEIVTSEMKDILSRLRAEVSKLEKIKLADMELGESAISLSVAESRIIEKDETIELSELKISNLMGDSQDQNISTAGLASARKRLKSSASTKEKAINRESEELDVIETSESPRKRFKSSAAIKERATNRESELPGTSTEEPNLSFNTPMKAANKVEGLRRTRQQKTIERSSKKEKLENGNITDLSSEDEVPVTKVRTTKRKTNTQKKVKKIELEEDDDSFEIPLKPKPRKPLRRYDKMAVSMSPVTTVPEPKSNVHQKVLRNLRQRK